MRVGEDPAKKYIVPAVKSEVPYLDFSPLAKCIGKIEKECG